MVRLVTHAEASASDTIHGPDDFSPAGENGTGSNRTGVEAVTVTRHCIRSDQTSHPHDWAGSV